MSTWAWEEVGKWIFFLLLLVAIIIVVTILFGGGTGVWERIKNLLMVGG